MQLKVIHVYRNTPLGRETLIQAADFVKKINGELNIFLPEYDRILYYFENDATEIRLDESYLYFREQARSRMEKALKLIGVEAHIVDVSTQTASNLPGLYATNYDVLSLPRVMVERQGQLHLPAVGAGVRQVVKNSAAPALIAPGRFHDWTDVQVLFGGSKYSMIALKWGLAISKNMGIPVRLISAVADSDEKQRYENTLAEEGIATTAFDDWIFIESNSPVAVLNEIQRTSLIVMGAYGHGRIHSKLFGSKTELIMKNTASLIMLIGENCKAPA